MLQPAEMSVSGPKGVMCVFMNLHDDLSTFSSLARAKDISSSHVLRYIFRRQGQTITESDRICTLESTEKDCAGLLGAASPISISTSKILRRCRAGRDYAAFTR